MSREAPIGLTIMEKIFGLLILALGFIMFYVTYTSMASIGPNPLLFLAFGLALIIVGIFLIVAKAE